MTLTFNCLKNIRKHHGEAYFPFCHICNAERLSNQEFCEPANFRSGQRNSFTGFLNGDFTNLYKKQKSQVTKMINNLACPNPKQSPEACRPILCPSGQLRAVNGSCIWPFAIPNSSTITLCLMLTPVDPLHTNSIEYLLNPTSFSKYPEWLSSPWPNIWRIKTIYYDISSGSNSSISFFIVEQDVTLKSKSINDMLKAIDKKIKKKWKGSVGNRSFEFDQYLSPSFRNCEGQLFHSDLAQTERRSLSRLFYAPGMYKKSIFVTKMFFCDHIELGESEYTFEANRDVVFNINTKQVLLDAEFTIMSKAPGNLTVRICLEDSGFTRYISLGCSLAHNCSLMVMMLMIMQMVNLGWG